MLIIVDSIASNLRLENAKIKVLKPTKGFTNFTEMILDRIVPVEDYKIIFLIISRAEVAVVEDLYLKDVKTCVDTIHSFNRFAIVVLGVTVPALLDSRDMKEASQIRI